MLPKWIEVLERLEAEVEAESSNKNLEMGEIESKQNGRAREKEIRVGK